MSPSIHSILDLPNEILIKIILHFNARERLALANSCEKFNNLVFGDKELLRNLDFSKKWKLTSETDIQKYFHNESTYKYVLRINIENVNAENILRTSIGKAINIVDLNILGTKIRFVEELHNFLEPLIHLKRLSINWPILGDYYDPVCNKVLEKSLSRLTYLSLELYRYSREFLLTLQLCQQLEELRMYAIMPSRQDDIPLSEEPMKLKNLKVIQFRGNTYRESLKNDFIAIIPNPGEWTDFYLAHSYEHGYLERNVEVSEELLDIKEMLPPVNSYYYCYNEELGWPLISEYLLSEAIRVTHEDTPEMFCCLSNFRASDCKPIVMKIDEAKRLLKDPGYQISYLHLSHVIERNCDAHLLASAFPNLRVLIIPRITNMNSYVLPDENEPFHRRLRKKGSMEPEERNDQVNPDSSFKMLIENTPHLRSLTIAPTDAYERDNNEIYWDLDALCLIPLWKNLTAIRLKDIPMTNGNYLTEIGKGCTKLEEIRLFRLDLVNYTSELLQMLKHCRNLKKLIIDQYNIQNISELFNTLSNNLKLRHFRITTKIETYDSLELTSSVEKMLDHCPELTKLAIDIHSPNKRVDEELKLALDRIVSQLNRPNFQFNKPPRSWPTNDYEHSSNLFFPRPVDY